VRGKTNWPEMERRRRSLMRGSCDGGGSKSVAPGGGFPAVRWTNDKGDCAKAAARLDPGASSVDKGGGGKMEERTMVSLHQNRGRNGGPVHSAMGRKERRGRTRRCGSDAWRRGVQATSKTHDRWGRSAQHANRGVGV
jgi:hypothetical protein